MQLVNYDSVVLYMWHPLSLCPSWERDPSSGALPEVSFFSLLKVIFLNMWRFSSRSSRLWGQRMSFTVQVVKSAEARLLWFGAIKIKRIWFDFRGWSWLFSQSTKWSSFIQNLIRAIRESVQASSPVSPRQTAHHVLPPPGTVCASGSRETSWCGGRLWRRCPCSAASWCLTLRSQGPEAGDTGSRSSFALNPL